MLMSGMDIKVLVLDTQVYSNTGGQSSTATFTGQSAKMAAFGKRSQASASIRKKLAQIAMMHPGVLVAQTTAAHLNHFCRCVIAANELTQAKLAVESRTFPLLVYDPRKGERLSECLSLQGNPEMKG